MARLPRPGIRLTPAQAVADVIARYPVVMSALAKAEQKEKDRDAISTG